MKCFFHSADLDGHCSGAIVKKKFPHCEMIAINYGDEFPWDSLEKDEEIYMVDFSLQPIREMMQLSDYCELFWIDHHATAIQAAEEKHFVVSGGHSLDTSKAACELTWEFLYADKLMPHAVRLLGRFDVWDHSDPNTLEFQYGLRIHPNTWPDNQILWKAMFSGFGLVETIMDGKTILTYERIQNTKFCDAYAFETVIEGRLAIAVNRRFCNSLFFESIYNPKKHDLMISFGRTKKKKWTVSLYSDQKDVHCGRIAQKFKGGGHSNAAGFQCEVLPFDI
jgi:oligoribonuclease NrnB/cAMP/cGMP phosphodiesterase (DHH superfamily)